MFEIPSDNLRNNGNTGVNINTSISNKTESTTANDSNTNCNNATGAKGEENNNATNNNSNGDNNSSLNTNNVQAPQTMIVQQALVPPPKCKNTETRRAAFSLLRTMISNSNGTKDNENYAKFTTAFMKSILDSAFWRTKERSDWELMPY